MKRCLQLVALLVSLLNAVRTGVAANHENAFTSDQLEFFETSVRPLLLAECAGCHGEKKQWAGLRLDSRRSILAGGDSGPAIVPGKPDESLLVEAVRRTSVEMPPEKPLTTEQVNILVKWVQMGAPWSEDFELAKSARHGSKTHWAFQPLREVALPKVADRSTVRNEIDLFVQANLEKAGLKGSGRADPRTLIRRLSYGLTGLPPTAEDVQKFQDDQRPEAWSDLVDEYLDSPQYGVHWSRKWLDLARYADTKGYVYTREERRSFHAWPYRDWVVDAFNRDLRYDQFLKLQIAADQIAPEDPSAQAAMGFLTVGRRFLGVQHDIIDDRIDVLCRTTMGLSVSCARCHDHKYDPIPTADYYSLYGVFQNCAEEIVPVTATPDGTPSDEFDLELKKRQDAFREAMEKQSTAASAKVRARIADYLFAQTELDKYPDANFNQVLLPNDLVPLFVRRWEAYFRRAKSAEDPVFLPWLLYAELPAAEFKERAGNVTSAIQNELRAKIHAQVVPLFETAPASMREVADRYAGLLKNVDSAWQEELRLAKEMQQSEPAGMADADMESLRVVLYGSTSPCSLPDNTIVGTDYFFEQGVGDELWKLHIQVEKLLLDNPAAKPHTIRLVDRTLIEEPMVFRRGNPESRSHEVPRHFLTVIAGENPTAFSVGSGRLEMAKAIAAESNPLTARVWVNRIWQHHFGVGLVPTSSDFGMRAPRPEQWELLDWLASQLIQSNWSTKAIQRLILNSATYQQNSTGPADPDLRRQCEERDPEVHLLWRMRPHRLTFEEWRDSMLQASGDLDLTLGGRSAELFPTDDSNHRRTLYGEVDRQFLPGVFRVFDFANPDLHIPARSETTVSQQALFALNHPFVADRAVQLTKSIDSRGDSEADEKIETLFLRLYQRPPTDLERDAARRYLSLPNQETEEQATPRQLAWSYGYGSVDENSKMVVRFEPLPYFTGDSWQGSDVYPDSKLGWVQLTADGGHPGNDHSHAAIRRWTASETGRITITSRCRHEVAAGNGMRYRVISSRSGMLSEVALHNSSRDETIADIQVEAGEALDFVVDINGDLNSDEYFWTVELEMTESTLPSTGGGRKVWNSQQDFAGSPSKKLSVWEQLAQVMLISNEFFFVD